MIPIDSIYIKGAEVFTADGFIKSDLFIKDGKIEKIIHYSEDLSHSELSCGRIIDADDCLVLPSFVDMHVHLREPGFSYKETIRTGTEAAAAGGFTCVCPMPNLNPAPDSPEHLDVQISLIQDSAVVDVLPFATITKQRKGNELVNYKEMSSKVAGFSDDGTGVQSEQVMRKAMKEIAKTGKILSAHCEVESLLKGGYIHEGGYAKRNNHKGISSESEWKEVERDIELVRETGCRLHICHMSTKESVDLVRKAKEEGLPVTCETGPHYLTFNDEDLLEEGRFKMNPPIRSNEDQKALQQGIIDGTIDVIATDHAPHSLEEKTKGLEKSAMGVVGLETAFSAVYTTMVESGLMPLERLIEVMAVKPREILGLNPMPFIEEGMIADLVIVDLKKDNLIDPAKFKSMGKATPYEGMKLKGKIKSTIYHGNPVYISL